MIPAKLPAGTYIPGLNPDVRVSHQNDQVNNQAGTYIPSQNQKDEQIKQIGQDVLKEASPILRESRSERIFKPMKPIKAGFFAGIMLYIRGLTKEQRTDFTTVKYNFNEIEKKLEKSSRQTRKTLKSLGKKDANFSLRNLSSSKAKLALNLKNDAKILSELKQNLTELKEKITDLEAKHPKTCQNLSQKASVLEARIEQFSQKKEALESLIHLETQVRQYRQLGKPTHNNYVEMMNSYRQSMDTLVKVFKVNNPTQLSSTDAKTVIKDKFPELSSLFLPLEKEMIAIKDKKIAILDDKLKFAAKLETQMRTLHLEQQQTLKAINDITESRFVLRRNTRIQNLEKKLATTEKSINVLYFQMETIEKSEVEWFKQTVDFGKLLDSSSSMIRDINTKIDHLDKLKFQGELHALTIELKDLKAKVEKKNLKYEANPTAEGKSELSQLCSQLSGKSETLLRRIANADKNNIPETREEQQAFIAKILPYSLITLDDFQIHDLSTSNDEVIFDPSASLKLLAHEYRPVQKN